MTRLLRYIHRARAVVRWTLRTKLADSVDYSYSPPAWDGIDGYASEYIVRPAHSFTDAPRDSVWRRYSEVSNATFANSSL
jgi:hypothetical protein